MIKFLADQRWFRPFLRGPVPAWWQPLCMWCTCLNMLAGASFAVGLPFVALVPGALGLVSVVIASVVFFRAPRIYP
jgi:predicted membrane protein